MPGPIRRTPPQIQAQPVRTTAYRGAEARARSVQERQREIAAREARQAQQNQPFRFRLHAGEEADIVILDDEPDFHDHEHNLFNEQTGVYDIYCGCINEWANCPADAVKPASFVLKMTIIDLRPYTDRAGNQVDFSRKLFVVKSTQQPKIYRLHEQCVQQGRTMRGAVIHVIRDGDKDASSGNDFALTGFYEEAELEGYVREYSKRDGTVAQEACYEVYPYDDMFPAPTEESIRALMGVGPAAGSRAESAAPPARPANRAAPRAQPAPRIAPKQPAQTTRPAPLTRPGFRQPVVVPETDEDIPFEGGDWQEQEGQSPQAEATVTKPLARAPMRPAAQAPVRSPVRTPTPTTPLKRSFRS